MLGLLIPLAGHAQSELPYRVPKTPWAESFGNHRAVIQVNKAAEKVLLNFTWRRHDPEPENKRFIIVEAVSGDTIPIIERIRTDGEKCELVFGPVKNPGVFHFYYLSYQVQTGYGFYYGNYHEPEAYEKGKEMSDKAGIEADIVAVEARTEFDSFYPMELIALEAEKDSLLKKHDDPFLVFPEDREFPIRMKDNIPLKWIQEGTGNSFHGQAFKNEYFVFQLGVFASQMDLKDLRVEFSALSFQFSEEGVSKKGLVDITCFNTGGVDPYGEPFVKKLDVQKGEVQALWIGVDIPASIDTDKISGDLKILAEDLESRPIKFEIDILQETLEDRGDSETWRHSRLRWLNSTAGIDDEPVNPYGPVDESFLKFNRKGFPNQIHKGEGILASAIDLIFETEDGAIPFSYSSSEKTKDASGIKEWQNQWSHAGLSAELIHSQEFDGYQRYKLKVRVSESIKLNDIRLQIPFLPESSTYMMGMGLPGCSTPDSYLYKWEKPEDSFWIGSHEAGLWCEIRGSSYHGPLQNLYRPGHPQPWYNDNQGYLSIQKDESQTLASVGTGSINLTPGKEYIFEFALLPTPVKELNPADQFTNRYYHNWLNPGDVEEDLHTGIKIVNVHHANKYNPFINYPFIAVDELRKLVDDTHDLGLKTKIYYTIRELTNHVTEIWALRSFGDEILRSGNGGGYTWLREHFIDDYHPQWYQHFENVSSDASLLTSTTDSRWYNYYIEGLRWLVKNQDIDGLYLDDVSFDRRMLKRMRKVMEAEKPGCILDLHSNTGFSKGPAIQYTEFFPYIDKLWFGESFQYNNMSPENWLVEVSGIPFGLMGDMLHGGGNRWLGMLFGMTVRLPWESEGNTADPRPVWKFWDDFGIADAEMIGFWAEACPVRVDYTESTDNKDGGDIEITVYKKSDKVLLAIGNFGEQTRNIQLNIDWDKLELNPSAVEIYAPAVKNFQPYKRFRNDEHIVVPAKEGWLIIIH